MAVVGMMIIIPVFSDGNFIPGIRSWSQAWRHPRCRKCECRHCFWVVRHRSWSLLRGFVSEAGYTV